MVWDITARQPGARANIPPTSSSEINEPIHNICRTKSAVKTLIPAQIEFCNVTKTYGPVAAVRDLSLIVYCGEFLTILGARGSGKTTTLMLRAGFEAPTKENITICGKSVVTVPSYRRDRASSSRVMRCSRTSRFAEISNFCSRCAASRQPRGPREWTVSSNAYTSATLVGACPRS